MKKDFVIISICTHYHHWKKIKIFSSISMKSNLHCYKTSASLANYIPHMKSALEKSMFRREKLIL